MFGKLDWVAKVNAAKFQFKNEHQSSMGGCLASSDESLNFSLFGNRRCTRPLCPAKLSLMFSIMSQRMFSIKIQQMFSIKIPQMFSIMIPQELDMHLKTALGSPTGIVSGFFVFLFSSFWLSSLSFFHQTKVPPVIQIKCKRTLFESIFGKDVVGKICWNYLPIFVLTFHDVHLNSATKQTLHPPLATHSTHLISVSKLTVENSHNIRFKRRLKRIREENVQVFKRL